MSPKKFFEKVSKSVSFFGLKSCCKGLWGKTPRCSLTIDYNWGELNVYSNTRYDMEEECLAVPMMAKCAEIDMEPDDIDVSDTATFVWEIK